MPAIPAESPAEERIVAPLSQPEGITQNLDLSDIHVQKASLIVGRADNPEKQLAAPVDRLAPDLVGQIWNINVKEKCRAGSGIGKDFVIPCKTDEKSQANNPAAALGLECLRQIRSRIPVAIETEVLNAAPTDSVF